MIIKSELVNQIKEYFGLNIYETKVWLALLGKGIASAGEIAEISRVPRSRTYDVLESLEKKGFIIMKVGKPIKYLAVPPEEVVERVKKNLVKEAQDRSKRLEKLKDEADLLAAEECALAVFQSGEADPVQVNLAAIHPVDAADQVQQGGFAAAALAQNSNKLPLGGFQGGVLQYAPPQAAFLVVFAQIRDP